MRIHFQIQFVRKLLKIFGPDMANFLKNIWRIIVGIGFIQKFSTGNSQIRKNFKNRLKVKVKMGAILASFFEPIF